MTADTDVSYSVIPKAKQHRFRTDVPNTFKKMQQLPEHDIFFAVFPEQNDLNRSHMDVGEVLQMNNSSRASTTKLQLGPAPHLLCPVGKSIEGLPWN